MANLIKQFTIATYDSFIILTRNLHRERLLNCNYNRKLMIRLATYCPHHHGHGGWGCWKISRLIGLWTSDLIFNFKFFEGTFFSIFNFLLKVEEDKGLNFSPLKKPNPCFGALFYIRHQCVLWSLWPDGCNFVHCLAIYKM